MQSKPVNVLVTRPEHQAGHLVDLIEQQGWCAVRFPTLEILPLAPSDKITHLLRRLSDFDTLLFISPNAVNFALQANSGKIDLFKNHRIAAVGGATAKVLKTVGLSVSWVPVAGFNSEALLDMPAFQTVEGQSFLIIRGEGGREILADTLRARGATVDYLEIYKRVKPKCDNREIIRLLTQHELDVVTITSGEALQNLVDMLEPDNAPMLFRLPLVVVSQRIKDMASAIGFKRIMIAEGPADAAILKTVTIVCNGEYSGRIE